MTQWLLDVAGAVATLATLGLLLTGGFLVAVLLSREDAHVDRLGLTIATLVGGAAQAVLWA